MKNLLLKQAIYVPLIYFGTIFISGIFAEDYSHNGQHASELAINDNKIAGMIFNIGVFITGLSLIIYGLGLLIRFKSQFSITSVLIIIFGITFLFGAIYDIGSPWHGLYGMGLSVMLLPFAFLYEIKDMELNRSFKPFSVVTTFVIFIYFWAMVARLDPLEYRGLTQRIFGLFVFGWIAYSSFSLKRLEFILEQEK